MCKSQLVCIVDFELVQKIDVLFVFARIGQVDQGDSLLADPEQAGVADVEEVIVGAVEVRPERAADFLQPLLRTRLRLILRGCRFVILLQLHQSALATLALDDYPDPQFAGAATTYLRSDPKVNHAVAAKQTFDRVAANLRVIGFDLAGLEDESLIRGSFA